ncbi:MAG TPA: sulfite exporter TauE/SafE family protein [Aliiroseovarius sp.]|nr:sulfite exporter TauE/SafE family protein [Aliiroseovarius sp.]
MPDIFAAAWGQDHILILAAAAFIAGLVRGFAGFGTAMVYMPVAGQIISPVAAIITLTIMDIFGPLPNVPGALHFANKRDLARLWLGLALALPLGLFLLTRLEPQLFRYLVSAIALVMLVMLAAGLRYHGRLTGAMTLVAGALGGFLGGVSGLAGPPVIMLYMASTLPAAVIRATLLLFLVGVDVLMLAALGLSGQLAVATMALGLLLAVPFLVGNVLGGLLFHPGYERIYRAVAYAIIAVSALSGLPLFDGGMPWS